LGRLAIKDNKELTTALTAQLVELGGVPISKEEIKQQVLDAAAAEKEKEDEEEEEAGPSSNKKKKKKGVQQKINKMFPKASAHPASTGLMGLLLGIFFMGIKSVGAVGQTNTLKRRCKQAEKS
jgi:hypothetical protein